MNYYIRILVDKKSYKNNSDDEVQNPLLLYICMRFTKMTKALAPSEIKV